MKKTYLSPLVEALPFAIENEILTASITGKSSTNLSIVDETDEDDWTF